MMGILAKGLEALVGPYFKVLVLPAILLALAVSVHKNVQGWGDRIEVAATNECNLTWRGIVSKRKERVAAAELQAARDRFEGERAINMGLNNDLEKVRAQAAQLEQLMRERSASDDDRCVSAGVWDDIRHNGLGAGSKGASASRGSGKGNPAKD
jgi:hypothetical protein